MKLANTNAVVKVCLQFALVIADAAAGALCRVVIFLESCGLMPQKIGMCLQAVSIWHSACK